MGTFVAMMGAANLGNHHQRFSFTDTYLHKGGRFLWSSFSDVLARKLASDPFYGRKIAFSLMWGIGPPLYLLVMQTRVAASCHFECFFRLFGRFMLVPMATRLGFRWLRIHWALWVF